MNFLSFPRIWSKYLKIFPLFLLTLVFLSQSAFAQSAQQLSLVDIITVLRSKKATPAEKNQLLTDGVKQRGVTFAINADLEKELRTAGADETLVAAIREKSPVVKPTPQPTPAPTPVPVQKQPDFTFYQNRANANFVLGEYDTAINDYNKAIELNPKESTIYFSRGLAYFNNKNFTSAITDFDKVIELDPKEATAYFKRGNALEKVGNFEKAVSDYQKAVELDADNEPAKAALQKLQAAMPKPTPATTVSKNVPQPKETEPQNNQTPTTATTDKPNANEPLNIGALNRFASKLAVPVYPAVEKLRNSQGLVTVEVVLDEEGKIVSVKATSGPRGLRQSAEDAVRKSKFKPVIVGDKTVKAIGFINFNFII